MESLPSLDESSTINTPIRDNCSSSQSMQCTDSITNKSSPVIVPILRCVDKPSSSLPSQLTFTKDLVRASVGFH
jgi:hypothetical protein